MHYSIQPKNTRYVKGYGFLCLSKNNGKNISNKYSQKLVDSAKKICSRCNKNCFKKSNSKTAEATGYLTGNKIADKILSVSTKSKDLYSKEANNERYVSPKERQQIIDGLRLI